MKVIVLQYMNVSSQHIGQTLNLYHVISQLFLSKVRGRGKEAKPRKKKATKKGRTSKSLLLMQAFD